MLKKVMMLLLVIVMGIGFSTQGICGVKRKVQRGKKVKAGIEKKININKADEKTLMKLKGIGKKKARAIVEFRKKNGKFRKVEDIMLVKGIGRKTFERLKPYITVK